ncbi:5-oxoprolinase subunit PxpB [uncultured Maribacter sp.]|uniref:5-oxoprolinase subunit PxpB n=1 Tax=uncultured Maribacter sp. TaxID=431308 RepID=UPI002611F0CA|nr:5-oxoprolinase subunit PxpB [uncultured Maribacter sp.]
MSNYTISIRPFGQHAILIEWPNIVDEAILEDILQFKTYLAKNFLFPEKWEIIPSYNSLTLVERNFPINFNVLKHNIKQWYSKKSAVEIKREKNLWKLPVCYDTDFGVDLEEVASTVNKSVEEVIALHTKQSYTIYGIGFLPGFMYLGGLPADLEVSRREVPRQKVLKGSVGLAGKQTGIYPQQSPGGWNIIGSCPVSMFKVTRENPVFVSVGDKVEFFAIERAEYNLCAIENEAGVYTIQKIKIDA